jgi:hypothetical protein
MRKKVEVLSWLELMEGAFAMQMDYLQDVLEKRLLPTFANAEEEAKKVEEEVLKQLQESPGDDFERQNPELVAEGEGMMHYETLKEFEQGILNMFLAACYHLFEQQICMAHNRLFVMKSEQKHRALIRPESFYKRLADLGIKVQTFPSWREIQELKLITNVVKHGGGKSADSLKRLRPELFINPDFEGFPAKVIEEESYPQNIVFEPLCGKGLFLTIKDLKRYANAAVCFWSELRDGVERQQKRD